eukprot:scaffold37511_cov41-Phaeocystis_antarctica.AAC.1
MEMRISICLARTWRCAWRCASRALAERGQGAHVLGQHDRAALNRAALLWAGPVPEHGQGHGKANAQQHVRGHTHTGARRLACGVPSSGDAVCRVRLVDEVVVLAVKHVVARLQRAPIVLERGAQHARAAGHAQEIVAPLPPVDLGAVGVLVVVP